MTHIAWLNMKFGQDVPAKVEGTRRKKIVTPAVLAPLIKDRLAELTYRNGGSFTVSAWGITQPVGIYGEIGLHAKDAFDLAHLSGILVGFSLASDLGRQQVYDDVMAALKDVWREKGWTEDE